MTGSATVAEAVAIAALDARTGTTVNYNFNIVDTAAAILAAPIAVLDSVTNVSVKGAVDVATAAQVLALNTADTTIVWSTLAVTDTVAALKAARGGICGVKTMAEFKKIAHARRDEYAMKQAGAA